MLCDSCFTGRVSGPLEGTVQIMPRLTRSIREDDGDVSQIYEGQFAIAGVWYQFALSRVRRPWWGALPVRREVQAGGCGR